MSDWLYYWGIEILQDMIKLNDYLYSGDTVLKILHNYARDLKATAIKENNQVDLAHVNFLNQIIDLLEHNDFLTSQSQRIREFYKYMVGIYPDLAFTFKGRIKSLIRAEEKFNGYVVEFVSDYYKKHGAFPSMPVLLSRLNSFRDLIAYRIIISIPRCHLPEEADREEEELKKLYDIANRLPFFLEERGFTPQHAGMETGNSSQLLAPDMRDLYRDYIANVGSNGYRSLHITLYDDIAGCYIEVQLRTKDMDDQAEIGTANHLGYEKNQAKYRSDSGEVPLGVFKYYDEACEREEALVSLDLAKLDVNMFAAANNLLINDGCGLFRGRQITPFEHLSRFQNDLID